MKWILPYLLISSSVVSGMNSTENRQELVDQDLFNEMRRIRRTLYMSAFFENNRANREAYNILNMSDTTGSFITGVSPEAIAILQQYKFLDEKGYADTERIIAWNRLKNQK